MIWVQSNQSKRREKRNIVRDQNRPIYAVESSPEYDAMMHATEESDGCLSEEEEEESRTSKNSRELNSSLEYVKRREEWNLQQRATRRKIFNKNRRKSAENQRPSDDWGQFQSCVSLENSSVDVNYDAKKGVIRNFLVSHHAQVNRLSDIYVKPPQRSIQKDPCDEKRFSFQEVRNILLAVGFAFIAIFWMALKKH